MSNFFRRSNIRTSRMGPHDARINISASSDLFLKIYSVFIFAEKCQLVNVSNVNSLFLIFGLIFRRPPVYYFSNLE